ncbi:hypothetical protein [Pelagicoccus sp. SDUM812002]|uniref:hypothetical protein n=1 Tax=Pelagicoccus sp. SDUM812002 TaxID=3041266 RepID=UPI002810543E|nr:hypothetical protein [Pelagicoccus sp. SDUM812002]MDQ8185027.1 hypothetical protein [Pelagicoccus sp. SDUM812002]
MLRFAILGTLLLFLPGCVYFRLLDVKSQLKEVERYFAVERNAAGMEIGFLDPTLRDDDLERLGVVPLRSETTEDGEVWEVEMRKRLPAEKEPEPEHHVWTELRFEEGLLVSVLIPDQYLACFPPDLILATMKALGDSRVLKLKKSVAAQTEQSFDEVLEAATYEQLLETFGAPYKIEKDEDEMALVYSYEKGEPEDLAEERRSDRTYEIRYILDPAGDRLLAAGTKSISIRYPSP